MPRRTCQLAPADRRAHDGSQMDKMPTHLVEAQGKTEGNREFIKMMQTELNATFNEVWHRRAERREMRP
eukprot:6195114-Pyramimonas_sp.AAC.1